jgi:hypothetical protein
MAIRTNGLKNFKGQTYATTFDVAEAISALKQSGKDVFLAGLLGTGTSADSGKVAMYNEDGVFQSTGYTLGVTGVTTETDFGGENKLATESGVAAYVAKIKQNIEGSALGIAEGQNVYFTDGKGTTKEINAFGYKLVKKDSANDGYAATYELQISDRNGKYETVTGSDPINIVKDQFLKSATMVWGASATLTDSGDVLEESPKKTDTAKYPFLKMEMYTNDNGDDTDDVLTTTVYIPVAELFRDYTYETGATQVQLEISDNVFSATLVNGGVVTSNLADSAVTNAKIATGTIEKGKFVESVQTSLGLADTAIQAGDVARIAYTPMGEGATATNVKDYLDILTENLNNIDVTAEIEKLDVPDKAVEGQYVSSVSEVDGRIVVSRVALPVKSVTVDEKSKELKVNGTSVATLTPDGIGADAAGSASAVLGTPDDTADKATVYGAKAQAASAQATADAAQATANAVKNTIVDKVVHLAETDVIMMQQSAEIPSVGKVNGRVLAVFDADGVQVYPEITYDKGESTITADFGESKSETFTVIHTVAITITI